MKLKIKNREKYIVIFYSRKIQNFIFIIYILYLFLYLLYNIITYFIILNYCEIY